MIRFLRSPCARRWCIAAFCCTALVDCGAAQTPTANPFRPSVTSPATLPPVGYVQLEQGYLGSLDSAGTVSQYGVNQATRLSITNRLMVEVQSQPFAQSRTVGEDSSSGASGDVLVGGQAVLYLPPVPPADSKTAQAPRRITRPTFSVAYLGRVHAGTTPDTDQGSYRNALLLLMSGDLSKFHYDSNFVVTEQRTAEISPISGAQVTLARAQFAQTLSVSHPLLGPKLVVDGEIYHFTQPLVHATAGGQAVARANAVDGLFAVSYTLRPNLVLDGGFSHGFTSTATRWQSFAGFTYLVPHRLWRTPS